MFQRENAETGQNNGAKNDQQRWRTAELRIGLIIAHSSPSSPLSISDFRMKLPSVTTFSPGFQPFEHLHAPALLQSEFDHALLESCCRQRDENDLLSSSVCSALSGMTSTSCNIVVTISTSANMPGFQTSVAVIAPHAGFYCARIRFHLVADTHDFAVKLFPGIREDAESSRPDQLSQRRCRVLYLRDDPQICRIADRENFLVLADQLADRRLSIDDHAINRRFQFQRPA